MRGRIQRDLAAAMGRVITKFQRGPGVRRLVQRGGKQKDQYHFIPVNKSTDMRAHALETASYCPVSKSFASCLSKLYAKMDPPDKRANPHFALDFLIACARIS